MCFPITTESLEYTQELRKGKDRIPFEKVYLFKPAENRLLYVYQYGGPFILHTADDRLLVESDRSGVHLSHSELRNNKVSMGIHVFLKICIEERKYWEQKYLLSHHCIIVKGYGEPQDLVIANLPNDSPNQTAVFRRIYLDPTTLSPEIVVKIAKSIDRQSLTNR